MSTAGFSFVYPMCMSLLIYGGSLEFVAVEMLLGPFAPVQTFIMAVLIQARHLFYGLSMLEKFKGLGWEKFYLIFGMCLFVFGADSFMIPTMIAIIALPALLKKTFEKSCPEEK